MKIQTLLLCGRNRINALLPNFPSECYYHEQPYRHFRIHSPLHDTSLRVPACNRRSAIEKEHSISNGGLLHIATPSEAPILTCSSCYCYSARRDRHRPSTQPHVVPVQTFEHPPHLSLCAPHHRVVILQLRLRRCRATRDVGSTRHSMHWAGRVKGMKVKGM